MTKQIKLQQNVILSRQIGKQNVLVLEKVPFQTKDRLESSENLTRCLDYQDGNAKSLLHMIRHSQAPSNVSYMQMSSSVHIIHVLRAMFLGLRDAMEDTSPSLPWWDTSNFVRKRRPTCTLGVHRLRCTSAIYSNLLWKLGDFSKTVFTVHIAIMTRCPYWVLLSARYRHTNLLRTWLFSPKYR